MARWICLTGHSVLKMQDTISDVFTISGSSNHNDDCLLINCAVTSDNENYYVRQFMTC